MPRCLPSTALLLLFALQLHASWLSDITGIDINIPRGTITIGAPNPAAIPRMLENLPKDAAQFFLNPVGSVLATAIRHAKEQARYGCRPLPSHVAQSLSRFFPPDILGGVCYNVADSSRIALDNLLLRHFNNGAVTLEDVIVFRSSTSTDDPVLWAHELMHVLQYRRLGLETFAHVYTYNFNALENEAYNLQNLVERELQSAQRRQQYWQYSEGGHQAYSLSAQQYSHYAQQTIDPRLCSRFYVRPGFVDLINSCPIPVRSNLMDLRHIYTGQVRRITCTTPRCTVLPGQASTWTEDPGWMTIMVYLVW